ncbi:long-chain fatty acid--CoA ligase [Amycolatopsis rubida]|uniref:Long-chain fatty acid--CoA ligase n=1 Tax=Amycolatopsis rubida TaxID=112413 RepID=A0ABX0C3K7_9PSEU|nr:AMP-binding protein [Amycolatopsis sp. M39]MYW97374.1 AMP-binding protein [Amycolatopsis rubida]NEC62359.1 long-chain fatty acid--CoA ligase [Amycolatopsis rubida]OAP22795.1 Long-chain-fatty-acid--CoA ligase [Amycolatopsis sp. M39]
MEVPDLLAHAVARRPRKTCVRVASRALSFAEVSDRADRFAEFLRSRGIGPGDRVAVLAYNEIEYLEVRVGTLRAGAVHVPLNFRLSAPELGRIVEDCDPALLVVGPRLYPAARAAADRPMVFLAAADPEIPAGVLRYEDAIAAAAPAAAPAEFPADRLAMISYTSGTTGQPKGAMLTHGALHAAMISLGQEIGARPDGVYLAAMPMFHIGAQLGHAFTYLGGTCRQLVRFDPADAAAALSSGEITHAQLVPSMIRDVLARWPANAPSRLRRVLYGAAPMPPGLLRRAIETWGCEFVNGYGSTEALGVCVLPPEDHQPERAPGLLKSIGRSAVGMRMRVVTEDGKDAGPGEIGEIACRGPNLMSGYWRQPEATAECFRDGWFRTGDLAYRDAEGYHYLVDRLNDKIVSGGENVYPTEVENVLLEHADVRDVAVVGTPDPYWGEIVTAAVVPLAGAAPGAEDLKQHCRGRIAGYKIPKRIRFVSELARSPTGKVLRREIRRQWPGDGTGKVRD